LIVQDNLGRNLGRPRKRQLDPEVAFVSRTVIPSPDDAGITHRTVSSYFPQEGIKRRTVVPTEIPHLLLVDEYSDGVRIVGVRGFRAQGSLLINLDPMFSLPAPRKFKQIGLIAGFAHYLLGVAPAFFASDLFFAL
jgi:hypothetical protein